MFDKKKKLTKAELEQLQADLRESAEQMIQKGVGAEAFLMTIHVVRGGKIHHTMTYRQFPHEDWGKVLIALGYEARNAALKAQTGARTAG